MSAVTTASSAARKRYGAWKAAGALLFAGLAALAYFRGGLLGLPAVPAGLTGDKAGLANLGALGERARALESAAGAGDAAAAAVSDPALARAARGLAALRRGDVSHGLEMVHRAIRLAPDDLVLGNAYRMAVFHLRRDALADAARRQTLAERLPPALEHEPIAFLEGLRLEHPSRETTLQLALAWVDELLLFPALEIKAPASVESVNLFSEVLAEDPYYVPALFGRGLNYLHRPARLVWPESRKAAPGAASRDLGLCVAFGRKVGGAPPRLVATLALTLGDAYAKEGRPQRARSWWQIAENASRDPELLQAVRRRFGWQDQEMLARLEAELEGRMLDLEHPLTDLSVMWQSGEKP